LPEGKKSAGKFSVKPDGLSILVPMASLETPIPAVDQKLLPIPLVAGNPLTKGDPKAPTKPVFNSVISPPVPGDPKSMFVYVPVIDRALAGAYPAKKLSIAGSATRIARDNFLLIRGNLLLA
jgi:hypothetical protein